MWTKHHGPLLGASSLVWLAAAAMVLCWVAGWAAALINPQFTPLHLANGSQTILTVKFKDAKQITGKAQMEVIQKLKGDAPAGLMFDLSQAEKDFADRARDHLRKYGDEPSLFIAGKNPERPEESIYYVHVHSKWLQLIPVAGGFAMDQRGFDVDKMRETWNGGTDMLIRCIQYILSDVDNAAVPSKEGTQWSDARKIGALKGQARDIVAVDLAGDGQASLFVADDKGDHLFRVKGDAMEDITAKLKLQSASRFAAWGDFNGDGRAALASSDGKTLTIWSQNADGTFASAPAAVKLPADCVGIATIGLASPQAVGLLVSAASGPPTLLKPQGKGDFAGVSLPAAPPEVTQKLGKGQPCLVADFNGDSLIDVVQPFESGGLIYFGNKDGGFDAAKPCAVHGTCVSDGAITGKAALADFASTGHPDVLLADDSGLAIFQNHGDGTFEELLQMSGEAAKAGAAASWCGVADFNDDGRQDFFMTHHPQAEGEDAKMQIFFGRGFRSFGEAPDLENMKDVPNVGQGQRMALFADLRHVGMQDLAVVLNNGEIWWVLNDDQNAPTAPLCVRVRLATKTPFAGPANVSLWKETLCFGSSTLQCGAAGAYFGIPTAGSYTLKWTLPGGKEMSKTVTVEKPVDVVLEGN